MEDENKIQCQVCGEFVELDDFDFIEDMCVLNAAMKAT